jgi:hypothetical protein
MGEHSRSILGREVVIKHPYAWYENEYGYWIGYSNQPAGQQATRRPPFQDYDQADDDHGRRPAERDYS